MVEQSNQELMMHIEWKSRGDGLHHARQLQDDGNVIGLDVESLLSGGWDWYVWCSGNQAEARNGRAEGLDAAKASAEQASKHLQAELRAWARTGTTRIGAVLPPPAVSVAAGPGQNTLAAAIPRGLVSRPR